MGTPKGLESRLVPRAGYELELLPILPLNGVGPLRMVKGIAALPWAMLRAVALVVRGAGPAPSSAWAVTPGGRSSSPRPRSGINTVILEPNAKPGFTNRVLRPFVRKAACSYEEARREFGEKGVVTGNPVRGGFAALPRKAHALPHTLLVFGGSQGSRIINNAVVDALPHLPGADRLRIVHQTGVAMRDEVAAAYARAGRVAEVVDFLDDMEKRFARRRPRGLAQRRHHLRGADRGGQGGRARSPSRGPPTTTSAATRSPSRPRGRRG